jgi:hypothetical protein
VPQFGSAVMTFILLIIPDLPFTHHRNTPACHNSNNTKIPLRLQAILFPGNQQGTSCILLNYVESCETLRITCGKSRARNERRFLPSALMLLLGHHHFLPALFRHRCAFDRNIQCVSALIGYHIGFGISPLLHCSQRDLLTDTAVSYLVGQHF